MTDVTCLRCRSTRHGLDGPPVGGELGGRILDSICSDCWAEWTATSARMINHYQLVLGKPEDRGRLRTAMKQFLGLEAVPTDGAEPPEYTRVPGA